jgi:hypothetical protein
MSSKYFRSSQYHDPVLKVRDFIFEDIDKTLGLINCIRGAPNFLLALGLCCYTEYWGKLSEGVQLNERKSKGSFDAFLKRLSHPYYEGLLNSLDIYKDIRCGLAHSYLIEGGKNSAIDTLNEGNHGIVYDPIQNRYTFYVKTYFREFKSAVDSFINGLENGTERLDMLEDSLNSRPELI